MISLQCTMCILWSCLYLACRVTSLTVVYVHMKWVIYVSHFGSRQIVLRRLRFKDNLNGFMTNCTVFANKLKMARADLSCGETCEVKPQQLIVVILTFTVSINKLSLTLLRLTLFHSNLKIYDYVKSTLSFLVFCKPNVCM